MKLIKINLLTLFFFGWFVVLSCDQEKNPTQPDDKWVSCPQTDIPWPSLADSPWPMSTVNPQGIARTNIAGPQEGKVLWTLQIDHFYKMGHGGPAIGADGTIYISENQGDFVAITTDGQIKWRLMLEVIGGPVIAADSTIYVAGRGIYAVRPDGQFKKIMDGFFTEFRPLLGIDGTIYIKRSSDGMLFAFTPSGKIKWQNPNAEVGIGYSVASVDGKVIYLAGKKNRLLALNADTGSIIWSIDNSLDNRSGPTIDNQGNIYFHTPDTVKGYGYVGSADAAGNLRWKYRVWGVSYPVYSPYAGITLDYQGYSYFDWGAGVVSLDYHGTLRWQLNYPDGVTSTPVICDAENNLYLLNSAYLKCFGHRSDGTLRFKVEITDFILFDARPGAIAQNGTLIFGGSPNLLVAIK